MKYHYISQKGASVLKEELRYKEKTKHGQPGFPMVVYFNDFATYVANRIPWHFHDEVEFVVVTKGRAKFYIGSEIIELKEGNAVFMNANVLHQMEPVDENFPYMFSTLVSPGIFGTEQGVLLTSKYVTPYLMNEGLQYVILKNDIEWQNRCLKGLFQIYQYYMEKEAGYEYEMHNQICDIWFILWREYFSKQPVLKTVRSMDEDRIFRVLQYIDQHYSEELALDQLCDEVNISKSELCRCFQRTLHTTPIEYVMMYRINAAAKKLEQTAKSVTEISIETGFNSNSYFCRQFKRYMNCSPKEYRQKFM